MFLKNLWYILSMGDVEMLCFQIRLKYCILIGLFEKYFSYKSIGC